VALGRIAVAWAAVGAWLVAWAAVERRLGGASHGLRSRDLWAVGGEALLLALFAALWFGSLGAGAAWLPFLLLGALMEWPVRSAAGGARVLRVIAAGGLLAWVLAP
jgi:hypothetical protein